MHILLAKAKKNWDNFFWVKNQIEKNELSPHFFLKVGLALWLTFRRQAQYDKRGQIIPREKVEWSVAFGESRQHLPSRRNNPCLPWGAISSVCITAVLLPDKAHLAAAAVILRDILRALGASKSHYRAEKAGLLDWTAKAGLVGTPHCWM